MRQIKVRIEEKAELYMGEPTGYRQFQVLEATFSHVFRGCPLGRARTEAEAIADFVRRANADDNNLRLTVDEIKIVERNY